MNQVGMEQQIQWIRELWAFNGPQRIRTVDECFDFIKPLNPELSDPEIYEEAERYAECCFWDFVSPGHNPRDSYALLEPVWDDPIEIRLFYRGDEMSFEKAVYCSLGERIEIAKEEDVALFKEIFDDIRSGTILTDPEMIELAMDMLDRHPPQK